jgi:hypothetical protein
MSARRYTDKIDRFRGDVASEVRASLKRALTSAYAAYEEDKDDLGLTEPSMESLKGLLKFLNHPFRLGWKAPSLALNPEGHFVAVWDVSRYRYSVEFLSDDEADWIGVDRSYDLIERDEGHYQFFGNYEAPPFNINIPSRMHA